MNSEPLPGAGCQKPFSNIDRDLSTEVVAIPLSQPLIVAPKALARLVAHPREISLARAASQFTIPVCVSSTPSVAPMNDIRNAAPDANLSFQLYVLRKRRNKPSGSTA